MTDTRNDERPRAPWHLWVLGVLGLLWSAFAAFDYVMTVTRNEAYMAQFPQEMIAYWYGLPVWLYVVWALGLVGGLLGCALLLMRRRLAVPLLFVSLASAIVTLIYGLTDPSAPRMDGEEIIAGVIMLTSALLPLYAWWQARRGVLR